MFQITIGSSAGLGGKKKKKREKNGLGCVVLLCCYPKQDEKVQGRGAAG